jgi:hypothetical protein
MVQLIEQKVDQETLERALNKIDEKGITNGRRAKIENLMRNSSFGAVYCEYFLADNPIAYRDSLEHNQQFAKEATKAGIDLEVLRKGIPDEGVEIDFDFSAKSLSIQKLEEYATEIMKFVQNFYGRLDSNLIHCDLTMACILDLHDCDYVNGIIERLIRESLGESILSLSDKENKRYFGAIQKVIDGELFAQFIEYWNLMESASRKYSSKEERDAKKDIESINLLLGDSLNNVFCEVNRENLEDNIQDIKPLYEQFIEQGKLNLNGIKAKNLNDLRSNLISIIEKLESTNESLVGDHVINFSNCRDLISHLGDLEIKSFSSKLRNVKSARYFVKVEEKLPEDVNFGNDGGCCIAVSDSDLGNGDNVPFYQLDNGTVILGVYQQVGQRKPVRTGMVLAFATVDGDYDAALLSNSYELSESMTPLNEGGLNKLVGHITNYLHKFNEAAGFQRLGSGTHGYNTGREYIDQELLIEPGEEVLTKLPMRKDSPNFYSEVLTEVNISKEDSWSFVIVDD